MTNFHQSEQNRNICKNCGQTKSDHIARGVLRPKVCPAGDDSRRKAKGNGKTPKMQLTDNIIAVLCYIRDHPGVTGSRMPVRMRPVLRTAEDMELIVYSITGGWNLTPLGKAQL